MFPPLMAVYACFQDHLLSPSLDKLEQIPAPVLEMLTTSLSSDYKLLQILSQGKACSLQEKSLGV